MERMIKVVDLTPSPALRKDLDVAYNRVMSSGVYIGEKEVAAFEEEWAAYCGTMYCVGVGNGFDALQLLLRSYNVLAGEQVIVPMWTAAPTWHAVTSIGAVPVVIGYDEINYSTRVEIIVHLYGVHTLASPSDRIVIEDCAQAHGLHPLHDAAWSFYPTKNLGAYGDAGAITTNYFELAEHLRRMRSYGVRGAINSRLDPLQAAFLRAKLPYLNGWQRARHEHAWNYYRLLKDVQQVVLPDVDACSVWHQFVIRVRDRDSLKNYLQSQGIETLIHYPKPPYFKLTDHYIPWCEEMARTALSLPIGPHLSVRDIDYVAQSIIKYYNVTQKE